jgi:signal transduction histidine kinase
MAESRAPSSPYARRVIGSPRHLRLYDLPVSDVALALVLAVASLGAILTGEVDEGAAWVTIPVALVSASAVAARTRWGFAAAVAVALAGLAQTAFGAGSPGTIMGLVAILLVVYSAGAECDEAMASIALTAVLGSALLEEWLDHGSDYAFVTIEIGGIWLLGRAVRTWRSRATYAEQHQRDLARLEVAAERTRIARELHDVVAHSLSVIAVQADAAEAALDVDPSRVGQALRAIRGSARDALGDMRQMLYLLRVENDVEPDDLAPARGLADIAPLVAGMREAGLPVEADIQVPAGLPSGLGLAVYRIAQEGLTNVRRHAGTVPTRLLVTGHDHELRVEVHNDAPPAGRQSPVSTLSTGLGLVGVRERTRAAGGSLDAGPAAGGGYSLVARLPWEGGTS